MNLYTLGAQGQQQTVTSAAPQPYAIQLGAGLQASDLEWVWTRTGAATGHYTLRLTLGRGEIVLPDQAATPGGLPSAPVGLSTITTADNSEITASVLARLNTDLRQGSNQIEGTGGNDVLSASAWADNLVLGGTGDDTISSGPDGNHADTLQGGAGRDTYQISAGWGQDTISDSQDASTIRFGDLSLSDVRLSIDTAGNLLITHDTRKAVDGKVASGQLDVLTLTGFAAGQTAATAMLDSIVFADGQALTGQQVFDLIRPHGTASGDQLIGTGDGELLDGQGGDDSLYGGLGDDVYKGGSGNDLLQDAVVLHDKEPMSPTGLYDHYKAGASSDTYWLELGGGADTLFDVDQAEKGTTLAPTTDVLRLGPGIRPEDIDLYETYDSNPLGGQTLTSYTAYYGPLSSLRVQVRGTGDSMEVMGQFERSDSVRGMGVDQIVFDDGTVWTQQDILNRVVDTRPATSTNVSIYGQPSGTYTLTNGEVLSGGAGGNTYLAGPDVWRATISNNGTSAPDILKWQGVRPQDVSVQVVDATTLLVQDGPLRSISLNYNPGADFTHIVFDDGTVWQTSDLLARLPGATQGNDVLTSGSAGATISGLGGNDTLIAGAANQTLDGGMGNDFLDARGFWQTGETVRWSGGQGDDTTVFDAGYATILLDSPDVLVSGYENASSGMHMLYYFGQFTFQDPMHGGSLTWNYNFNVGSVSNNNTVVVRFADGSAPWTIQDLLNRIAAAPPSVQTLQTGSSGNDVMRGAQLQGGEGDDQLTLASAGGATSAVYNLGDGKDTLVGSGSQSTLKLGVGIDPSQVHLKEVSSLNNGQTEQYRLTINGHLGSIDVSAIDQIQFSNGQTWGPQDIVAQLAKQTTLLPQDGLQDYRASSVGLVVSGGSGNDTIYGGHGNDNLSGGAGDDVLSGGPGNDTLTGGLGADTYNFLETDGTDLIHADGSDTVNIAWRYLSDVHVGRLGAQGADTEVLTINNYFGGPDAQPLTLVFDHASQLSGLKLVLQDGTMTWDGIMAMAKPQDQTLNGTSGKDVLTGDDGNDTLNGLAGNDSLTGGAGNDSLNGGLGNDTLSGGTGNDTLFGDKGNDTYLFARGDGFDTIIDKDGTWFNSDALKISGAKSSQLWFTRVGSSLDIAIIGTSDHVTIQDWFLSANNRVEKITALGDNKTLNLTKLNSLVSAMASFTSSAMAGTDLPANTPAVVTKLVASSWS